MGINKRIEYLFCLLIIWGAVLVQGYAMTNESGEEKTVEAFQTLHLASIEGCVEVSAPINKLYLSQDEKENVLLEMAEELGIQNGSVIKDESKDEMERMELVREMDGENVSLSITTLNVPMENGNYKQNQYAYMVCSVEGDPEKLLTYKTLMEKIASRRGLTPSTNVNFKGEQKGKLSTEEKQQITARLFHSLDAKEVEAVKEEELYTVYGYSSMLKDSVAYGENEINLNLAFSYNEQEKKTVFYLSMPYIRMDY